MTIKSILTLISLGLLVYLLIDSLSYFDLAATKNDALINEKKISLDKLQNIDSVKIQAKQNLDVLRQNAKRDSKIAARRFWVITALIVTQFFLLLYYRTVRNKA